MDLASLCTGAVASHAEEFGLNCGGPAGEGHLTASPHIEILAHDLTVNQASTNWTVTVTIEARNPGSATIGPRVLAIGWGNTAEEAAVDAAHQWSIGVLPVIASHRIEGREIPVVEKSRMVVVDDDTGELFGWLVHLGDVIGRAFGPPGSTADLGVLSRIDAFEPVMGAIHPLARHRDVMWVESYTARYPDGRVDATCRLQNHDWETGRGALLAWAHSWPETRGHLISKRQFLILEPVPAETIPPEIRQQVDDARRSARLPWWRFGRKK